jgi:hypothetical protein
MFDAPVRVERRAAVAALLRGVRRDNDTRRRVPHHLERARDARPDMRHVGRLHRRISVTTRDAQPRAPQKYRNALGGQFPREPQNRLQLLRVETALPYSEPMLISPVPATLPGTPPRIRAAHAIVGGASLVCAALVLLAACATGPQSGPSDGEVQTFSAGGYQGAERGVATKTTHAWSVAGQALSIVLSLPDAANAAPLIIYLPGLGESSEAGELWRAAWSSAGYAVLSVQLLAVDERAWTSPLARSGEFRKLGLDRFGGAAARQRMRLLADVVTEGKRRSIQGEPTWARVDWNRLVIAGYDVGAYTAMIAAGEHLEGAEDRPPLAIRAVIALSPFTNPAASAVDRRYRDIRIPVLLVTSNADADPLGLTDGPDQRGVPFERMPGRDKYLLTLRDLSHARLGGGVAAITPEPEPTAKRGGTAGGGDLGPRRGAGQRKDQDERDEPPMERPRAVERAGVRSLSANALRMRVVAAQAVSTAFLDTSVKDDVRARDWLANDASKWLGGLGTLGRK